MSLRAFPACSSCCPIPVLSPPVQLLSCCPFPAHPLLSPPCSPEPHSKGEQPQHPGQSCVDSRKGGAGDQGDIFSCSSQQKCSLPALHSSSHLWLSPALALCPCLVRRKNARLGLGSLAVQSSCSVLGTRVWVSRARASGES